MSVLKQLKWRYATKQFDASKSLLKDQIALLKDAFNLTATSYGLQTLSLVVVSNRDLREQLKAHAYNQPQITESSHLLVICIQDDITDYDIDTHFENIKDIRKTPEDIVSPFRTRLKDMMKGMTKVERQQWSKHQAYITLGNLMTVCAVEGIDACPMEGFEPKAFDRLLNLKEYNLKSVLLLPVGFRSNQDPFASMKKVRKSTKNTIIDM
jgi:nitroreductase